MMRLLDTWQREGRKGALPVELHLRRGLGLEPRSPALCADPRLRAGRPWARSALTEVTRGCLIPRQSEP